MSTVFFDRGGWRLAVERRRWPDSESHDGEPTGMMEGVTERGGRCGGRGLKGGWRGGRWEWKGEAVRDRWDLNLRASPEAISIFSGKYGPGKEKNFEVGFRVLN